MIGLKENVVQVRCEYQPLFVDEAKNTHATARTERKTAQSTGCDFKRFDGEGEFSHRFVSENDKQHCYETERAGKAILNFNYWVYGLGHDYWFTFLQSQKQKILADFINEAKADALKKCSARTGSPEKCQHITTFFTGMEEGKGFARTIFYLE